MLIYMYNPVYYATIADWDKDECGEITIFREARRRQALLIPDDRYCIDKILADGLAVHAKIHGLSHKYDIVHLARVSCDRFVEYVVYQIHLNPTFTEYPDTAMEFVDVIKLLYGTEQQSYQILREAAVYLARQWMKSVTDHESLEEMKEAVQAFQETLGSVKDFAWDMVSLNFKKARFACGYCKAKFVISKKKLYLPNCSCAQRGLCGKCAPISQMECFECQQRGACRLIKWKVKSTNGRSTE